MINLNKVIGAYGPKFQLSRETISMETAGLEKRNTGYFIPKSKLAENANILCARFVLTIKNE